MHMHVHTHICDFTCAQGGRFEEWEKHVEIIIIIYAFQK